MACPRRGINLFVNMDGPPQGQPAPSVGMSGMALAPSRAPVAGAVARTRGQGSRVMSPRTTYGTSPRRGRRA